MFKSELDGMYHREQIKDYIREINADQRVAKRRRRIGRKTAVGAGMAGMLALLWSLMNFGQVAGLFHLFK